MILRGGRFAAFVAAIGPGYKYEARKLSPPGGHRKAHLVRSKLSQTEIAKLFGDTQPSVSDSMRGKINLFALDALVHMAVAAGLIESR
jgi:Helix-turn-helix domain